MHSQQHKRKKTNKKKKKNKTKTTTTTKERKTNKTEKKATENTRRRWGSVARGQWGQWVDCVFRKRNWQNWLDHTRAERGCKRTCRSMPQAFGKMVSVRTVRLTYGKYSP